MTMKKKPLQLRLSSFFGQQVPRSDSSRNLPELIKPESEWHTAESAMEGILRWADDGGQMLDLEKRTARSDSEDARKRENER